MIGTRRSMVGLYSHCDANDGYVCHGWMLEEEGFQFGGGNLVALNLDQLLQKHCQYRLG